MDKVKVGTFSAPGAHAARIDHGDARNAQNAHDFQITQARLRRELGPEWTPRLDEISGQAQLLINPLQPARPERASAEWRYDLALTWNKQSAREPGIEVEAGA